MLILITYLALKKNLGRDIFKGIKGDFVIRLSNFLFLPLNSSALLAQ